MTTTDTLRFAADLLHGLPGLPLPSVNVVGDVLTIKFRPQPFTDEHHRAVAVDMLCAVIGLTPEPGLLGDPDRYGAMGEVGAINVLVYASGCTVVVPA